jgi:hypothetical protein
VHFHVELGAASLYWIEDVVVLVSKDKEPKLLLKCILFLFYFICTVEENPKL